MSFFITLAVKIVLGILALERFYKYVMKSNMISILLFIHESDKVGRKKIKKKENDKRDSGKIN